VESRSALESVGPHDAPVAQLDRACASEAQGRVFESLRAHHFKRCPLFQLRCFCSDKWYGIL
jgi:hypothetical protein